MVTRPPKPVYDASGGFLGLDFVNSMDRSVGKPWVDRLTGYRDLVSWCADAGSLPKARAERLARAARRRAAEAEAVLSRARELREALYRIFAGLVAGASPARADLEILNAELAIALSHVCVAQSRASSGPGGPGAFELCWEEGPRARETLDAPIWPLARSAAELLTSPDRALVRRCASETCLWLFLDRTKNHGRRWCDMKSCGNRAKVRRHRRRIRAAARDA